MENNEMNKNEVNQDTQKKVSLKDKIAMKKQEIKDKRAAKKAEHEDKPGIGKKILVGVGVAAAVTGAALAAFSAGKRSGEIDPEFECEPGDDYELDELASMEETPVEEKTEE